MHIRSEQPRRRPHPQEPPGGRTGRNRRL